MLLEMLEAFDAGVLQVWPGSVVTHNSMREPVSSVQRKSLKFGIFTYD